MVGLQVQRLCTICLALYLTGSMWKLYTRQHSKPLSQGPLPSTMSGIAEVYDITINQHTRSRAENLKIEALESAAKMGHLAHHQNQKKHLRGADAWTRG